jgi:medium-chain acyl-[acyl-carrier-protein] hydrolase
VRELAATIAEEIALAIRGPFAFFGYSFGALLAFETARVLRRCANAPDNLIVAALKAPHLPLQRKPIHNLSDSEFADEMRKFRGTPDAVLQNAEVMSLVLPAVKADFTAYETYEYSDEAPLECPITVMGGARDPSVSQQELAAWGRHTSAGCAVRMFAGDHFFLHTARQSLTWTVVQELLAKVRAAS